MKLTVNKHIARMVFVTLLLLSITSCKHDPIISEMEADICAPDTVYFENDILPLLISNCSTSGCHDVASAEDNVVLVDYNSIITTGDVEPGNPMLSELFEVITETNIQSRMPPEPNIPLTEDQIQDISTWISQGALNNSCDDCDTTMSSYMAVIKPIIDLKCMGCHSGPEPEADFTLTNYDDISQISTNGILLDVLEHGVGDFADMPPNGEQLKDCEIYVINRWINNGALNN